MPTTRRTRELPEGLPGIAASPADELVDAIDGDDGHLYVRYPGKRIFQALGVRDAWRFQAAKAMDCGWWCKARAEHLLCAGCLADVELAKMLAQADAEIEQQEESA